MIKYWLLFSSGMLPRWNESTKEAFVTAQRRLWALAGQDVGRLIAANDNLYEIGYTSVVQPRAFREVHDEVIKEVLGGFLDRAQTVETPDFDGYTDVRFPTFSSDHLWTYGSFDTGVVQTLQRSQLTTAERETAAAELRTWHDALLHPYYDVEMQDPIQKPLSWLRLLIARLDPLATDYGILTGNIRCHQPPGLLSDVFLKTPFKLNLEQLATSTKYTDLMSSLYSDGMYGDVENCDWVLLQNVPSDHFEFVDAPARFVVGELRTPVYYTGWLVDML